MAMNKMRRMKRSGKVKVYRRSPADDEYMGMIDSDYMAPSNLPMRVKHTYYPKGRYVEGSMDDSIRGVDEADMMMRKKIKAQPPRSKY